MFGFMKQMDSIECLFISFWKEIKVVINYLKKGLLVSAMAACSVNAAAYTMAMEEREALIAIYNALDGDNWGDYYSWDVDVEGGECGWIGVGCSCETEILEEGQPGEEICTVDTLGLYLPEKKGVLPDAIGDFPNMTELRIHWTNIEGPINPNIGKLTNLRYLAIRANGKLTGEIPPELSNLKSLDKITIENCQGITGTIPSSFSEMSNLTKIMFRGLGLNQGIPEVLKDMPQLEWLALTGNPLGGEIPEWFGDSLQNLKKLDLRGTQLSGEIPFNFKNLVSLENDFLFLERNGLTSSDEEIVTFIESRIGEVELMEGSSIFEKSQATTVSNLSARSESGTNIVTGQDVSYNVVEFDCIGGESFILMAADSIDGEYTEVLTHTKSSLEDKDDRCQILVGNDDIPAGTYFMKVLAAFDEIEAPWNDLYDTPNFLSTETFGTGWASMQKPMAPYASPLESAETVEIAIVDNNTSPSTDDYTGGTSSSGGGGGGGSLGIMMLSALLVLARTRRG